MKGRLITGAVAAALLVAAPLLTRLEGRRHVAYPDPATQGAPWTICDGHTRDVKPGDVATDEQCDAYRQQDMAEASATIDRCIQAPLMVNERAALILGVVNIGPKLVCGSTLQQKANAGDMAGMCAELSRWVYADGKRWAGLMKRRATERALCETP